MPADYESLKNHSAVALDAPNSPWGGLSRTSHFFEDAAISSILQRAETYAAAGACLNLSGPAGLGKTSMALRVAERLGRPVSFMAGNQWLDVTDFVGREVGQSSRTVVDKYIQSVRRTDSEMRADWKDSILAVSMQRGYTLVYDEFTRASPDANSILISVLEEGILVKTDRASKNSYVEAHPDFRIICTSNPHDYVGVNGAPDALLDRMVTLPLPQLSPQTAAGIVAMRTGLDANTSLQIATVVHAVMAASPDGQGSSLRSTLIVARVCAYMIKHATFDDAALTQVTLDVMAGRGWAVNRAQIEKLLAKAKMEDRP
jgi:gas vesicle protein GvpN